MSESRGWDHPNRRCKWIIMLHTAGHSWLHVLFFWPCLFFAGSLSEIISCAGILTPRSVWIKREGARRSFVTATAQFLRLNRSNCSEYTYPIQRGKFVWDMWSSPPPHSSVTFQYRLNMGGGQGKRPQKNTGPSPVKSGLSLQTQRRSIHSSEKPASEPQNYAPGSGVGPGRTNILCC